MWQWLVVNGVLNIKTLKLATPTPPIELPCLPYYCLILHSAVLPTAECPRNNNCDQTCVLINATEQCSCNPGYMLCADSRTCYGEYIPSLEHNRAIYSTVKVHYNI